MGDFPLMTDKGTFIINGAERVVVSQLVRSPGVYFTAGKTQTPAATLLSAKLIPNRGAWLEFETATATSALVKIDGKRKIPITTLLRAIGYGRTRNCSHLFAKVDNAGSATSCARPWSASPSDTRMRRPSSRSTRSCAPATRRPGQRPEADRDPCSSTPAL